MRLQNVVGRLTRGKKLWLTLTLAGASGLAAAWLSLGFLRSQVRPVLAAPVPHADTRVAVAARDLAIGSLVRGEDVRLVEWPSGEAPAGYATSAEEIVGRGVTVPMVANEPFLHAKLASKDGGGGLPIVIPEGMRAVSVRVDEVIAVAGFVVPGTRVDVLAILSPGGSSSSQTSRVVLQNVPVLAAGQTVQRDENGKPMTVTVITLLVTPEQAEVLTLSSTQGRIQLALRNTLDLEQVRTAGVQVGNLVGYGSRRSGTGTGSGRAVVEMYRGGERTLKAF